jgi:hypothetical protein
LSALPTPGESPWEEMVCTGGGVLLLLPLALVADMAPALAAWMPRASASAPVPAGTGAIATATAVQSTPMRATMQALGVVLIPVSTVTSPLVLHARTVRWSSSSPSAGDVRGGGALGGPQARLDAMGVGLVVDLAPLHAAESRSVSSTLRMYLGLQRPNEDVGGAGVGRSGTPVHTLAMKALLSPMALAVAWEEAGSAAIRPRAMTVAAGAVVVRVDPADVAMLRALTASLPRPAPTAPMAAGDRPARTPQAPWAVMVPSLRIELCASASAAAPELRAALGPVRAHDDGLGDVHVVVHSAEVNASASLNVVLATAPPDGAVDATLLRYR